MEHHEVRALAAAYALDALDGEDERVFEEHVARCPECRDDVASLQEAAAALAYDADAPVPPPALRERILTRARNERPKVAPIRRPRWAIPAAGLAAAAACGALGLGLWAASLSGQLEDRPREIALSGARGSLVVTASREAVLFVDNLAAAPLGKTYEAWVIEDGEASPAGLFTAGGERTAVALTRPVPKGAVVAVTVELSGGAERPTAEPLFTAEAA